MTTYSMYRRSYELKVEAMLVLTLYVRTQFHVITAQL